MLDELDKQIGHLVVASTGALRPPCRRGARAQRSLQWAKTRQFATAETIAEDSCSEADHSMVLLSG